MYKHSTLLWVLTCLLLFCSAVECRRTSSSTSRRRPASNSQSAQNSGGGFGSGWFSGNTQGSVNTGKKESGSGASYGWTKPPSNTGGWGTAQAAKPAPKPASDWGSASNAQKPAQSNTGWANPGYNPANAAPKPAQTYGWTNPSQNAGAKPAVATNQFQTKPNPAPSSNIGPGGYPVQSGTHNTGYHHSPGTNTGGYNTGYNPGGHNTGYNSGGYNTGHNTGGYNTGYRPQAGYNNYQPNSGNPAFGGSYSPQGFSSNHGFSQNYYPSQNSFGYPGQGMFGGTSQAKYGGMGIFGGGGHSGYGYPGSGGWGSGLSNYGAPKSGGKGSLLTGLAVGAVGGYVASSLIRRVTNPWGYSGSGYGNNYGYDRSQAWRQEEYNRQTTTEAPAPRPEDQWIHCVAFDPTTKTTLINPNCSCTVTTMTDPATNLPISMHDCTTQNGVAIPPISEQQLAALPPPPPPQNAVNTPNASPSYSVNYDPTGRYGAAAVTESFSTTSPEVAVVSDVTDVTDASSTTVDTPVTEMQRGEDEVHKTKVEFFTKLEKLVNMGKFAFRR